MECSEAYAAVQPVYRKPPHCLGPVPGSPGRRWDQIAPFVSHLDQPTTQRYIRFKPKGNRETARSPTAGTKSRIADLNGDWSGGSGRSTESGVPRFEFCRLPLHDPGKIEYVNHRITASKDSE